MNDEIQREKGSIDDIPEVPKRECAVEGCGEAASGSIDVWAQDPGAMKATENLEWINIPLCADHLAEHDREGDKVFSARHRLKRP